MKKQENGSGAKKERFGRIAINLGYINEKMLNNLKNLDSKIA